MSTLHMGQERRHKDDEALCGAKVNDNLVWSRSSVTCWKCAHLLLGRPLPAEPACNEHDKLKAAKHEGRDATQLIGEFIEWMQTEKRYRFAQWDAYHDELCEVHTNIPKLIAEFFGINQEALEAEKMALLEYQRAYNKAIEWAQKEGIPFLQAHP